MFIPTPSRPSRRGATRHIARAALMLFAAFSALPAHAAFPDKPIHIVVPFAPGGGTDAVARMLGVGLGAALGQPVIVDNKPGAGTLIGSDFVAKSAPDGSTLVMATFAHAVNPSLQPKLPYDTDKAFAPVAMIGVSANVLVVRADAPYKTVADVLAAARAKPGTLTFASQGNGTSAHLAGELLNHMAGVRIVSIPFKGGAPALTSVMAGDIPMSINPLPEVVGQLDGGQLRAIAVTTAARAKSLPDVPTVAESGVAGYDTAVWWGFLGPANMPPALVARIQADIATALKDPVVMTALEKIGATPLGSSPAEFDAYMRAEAAKWGPILKEANIKIQ